MLLQFHVILEKGHLALGQFLIIDLLQFELLEHVLVSHRCKLSTFETYEAIFVSECYRLENLVHNLA